MSFFSSISIASQERIHTQVFSWFFSSQCSAIIEEEKISLLESIVGNSLSSTRITKVTTEEGNIDIIIYTDKAIVAFENKIKSTTHSNQLAKYDQILIQKGLPNIYRIYLSLFNEDIENPNWKIVTHREMSTILNKANFNECTDSIIFKDYLTFYSLLGESGWRFLETPSEFKRVFKDGSLKKHEKLNVTYSSQMEKFICINQLETIFQKMFYKNIVLKLGLNSNEYLIEETRGNALVNLYAQDFEVGGVVFQLGIQLQRNSIKVIFQDKSYNKSNNKSLPSSIVNYFQATSFFKGKKESLNLPRSKCYISKSSTFYWGYEFGNAQIDEIRLLFATLKNEVSPVLKSYLL